MPRLELWDDLESWCLLTSNLCCTRLIYFHSLNIVVHYYYGLTQLWTRNYYKLLAWYVYLLHCFYTLCSYVRSTCLFYALPKYLKDELVRVEKRAMSIICPGLPYQETIELVNIVPIVDFITGLCSNTFDTIIKDPEHRLNRLIQFSGPSRYALRCNRRFIVPKCKTDRFRNSFIIRSCIDNIYT